MMKKYVQQLKYLSSPSVWLENSYGLSCCPLAPKLYKDTNIFTYTVPVNSLFSDMEKIYPGFSDAIFMATITETLTPLQQLLKANTDQEAFTRWLGIVFGDCFECTSLDVALPRRMSAIYLHILKSVTVRLRGIRLYVVGYTAEGLLLASKERYSLESLKSMLGGLV